MKVRLQSLHTVAEEQKQQYWRLHQPMENFTLRSGAMSFEAAAISLRVSQRLYPNYYPAWISPLEARHAATPTAATVG